MLLIYEKKMSTNSVKLSGWQKVTCAVTNTGVLAVNCDMKKLDLYRRVLNPKKQKAKIMSRTALQLIRAVSF